MNGGALEGRRVLLGVSGGIAAYKAAALARALVRTGASVQAVLTPSATEFVGTATFEGVTGRRAYSRVFEDVHRIIHVQLSREADIAVVAPATANIIAKFALGIADDLLSSVLSCLTCPVVVAPAMHTEMWENPAVQANVARLRARGVRIVDPEEGELAGGDFGAGRLAEETVLVDAIVDSLRQQDGPLAGRRVVVTAGGTREPIDPVRFIGNRSSGKMGFAVALEAARRGATVDLVTGPTHLADPPGVTVHRVETALDMRAAVLPLAEKAEVVIKAAAVADFRPADRRAAKVKKEDESFTTVELIRNPDILAELGEHKQGRVLVGFAAETGNEEEQGRAKLARKNLDLIVVNRVDTPEAGFDVDTNRALVLAADGSRIEVPLTAKATLAGVLCDAVESLLRGRST